MLIKQVPISQLIPSPDHYSELEVLMKGIVTGAMPTAPLGPGTPSAF